MRTVEFAGSSRPPSKIVCIGRNYAAHIAELGNEVPEEMVVFFKPNSAIGQELAATQAGEAVHYEAEICFGVEGGELRSIGVGLDLTKRGVQDKLRAKGLPWERSKAFDGSAVFSGFVEFDGEFAGLELELTIDGERTQLGSTTQMLHQPSAILEGIKRFATLEDFDIVMTGTPKGVGALRGGACYDCVLRRGQVELARASWIAQP